MAEAPEDDEGAMRARLDALKGKLDHRAAERRERAAQASAPGTGGLAGPATTLAFQAGAEFVVAILLGAAIGWGLDRWLGTRPWLTVVFFLLGTVAGMRSVIRLGAPKTDGGDLNSRLSGGQAPDKDGPRSASSAAPQPPSGWDEDED